MITETAHPPCASTRSPACAAGAPETARARLKASGLRVTPPRLAVLQALSDAERPLSSGEVVRRIAEVGGDPATVYRNLVRLCAVGLAVVASRIDGVDRYALAAGDDRHQHPHFWCDACGRVDCLPALAAPRLPEGSPWAAAVGAATIQLHGACPECRAQQVESGGEVDR